jgi:hypothetical protein
VLIAREIGFHVEVDRSPILSLRQDAGPTKPEAWVAINPWQQRSKFGGDARARFVLQNSRRKHILQENPCIGQAAGTRWRHSGVSVCPCTTNSHLSAKP